jgi:flavin-binding protein dodecin
MLGTLSKIEQREVRWHVAPLLARLSLAVKVYQADVLASAKYVKHCFPPNTYNSEAIMQTEVFKTIQITGSSSSGSDEAIQAAVEKAAKSVRNLRWFKVTETRGHIENGKIAHWQVTIDLGFTLD